MGARSASHASSTAIRAERLPTAHRPAGLRSAALLLLRRGPPGPLALAGRVPRPHRGDDGVRDAARPARSAGPAREHDAAGEITGLTPLRDESWIRTASPEGGFVSNPPTFTTGRSASSSKRAFSGNGRPGPGIRLRFQQADARGDCTGRIVQCRRAQPLDRNNPHCVFATMRLYGYPRAMQARHRSSLQAQACRSAGLRSMSSAVGRRVMPRGDFQPHPIGDRFHG